MLNMKDDLYKSSARLIQRAINKALAEKTPLSDDVIASIISDTHAAANQKENRTTFDLSNTAPFKDGHLIINSAGGEEAHRKCGIEVICGASGKGKSLLSDLLTLELCLEQKENAKLPKIFLISRTNDKSEVLRTIKNAFAYEKEQPRILEYNFIHSHVPHAINIFDVPVGKKFPTQVHEEFLVKFISRIGNFSESDRDELLRLVSLAYYDAREALYTGTSCEVSIFLRHSQIKEDGLKWKDIADIMQKAGNERLHKFAHRQFMPTFSNLLKCAEIMFWKHGFQKKIEGLRNTLANDAFLNALLNGKTAMDFSDFDIVHLNIGKFAPYSNPLKQEIAYLSSLFYALNECASITDRYRLVEVEDTPKGLSELEGEPPKLGEILSLLHDTFENPPSIRFVTQYAEVLSKPLISKCDSVWCLGANSQYYSEKLLKQLSFIKEFDFDSKRLRSINSPSCQINALKITKDDNANNTSFVNINISPLVLWSLQQIREDVTLKRRAEKELGRDFLKILSNAYPNGTAIKEIEILKREKYDSVALEYPDRDDTEYERFTSALTSRVINEIVTKISKSK